MAEGCPHVTQVQLPSDKSFLNPRTWACSECGFTDSVWVSLNFEHKFALASLCIVYQVCVCNLLPCQLLTARIYIDCHSLMQACLVCGHVACGRTNSRHALKHFELTKVSKWVSGRRPLLGHFYGFTPPNLSLTHTHTLPLWWTLVIASIGNWSEPTLHSLVRYFCPITKYILYIQSSHFHWAGRHPVNYSIEDWLNI